ncbi:MAG: WG repeat-containing protein, partial [Flammeovirgaceae bacterium]
SNPHLFRLKKEGKWGILQSNGEWYLEPNYKYLDDFENKFVIAHAADGVVLLDSTKTMISEYFESSRFSISEGMVAMKRDGKWGYINLKGELVVKPQFDEAYDFIDGYAAVRIGEGWTYARKDGSLVTAPKYKDVRKDKYFYK